MPPLDLPSPALGPPVVHAANPVVAATEIAREHRAELAIGPRATEQAIHAALRRSELLAAEPDVLDDHEGLETSPDELQAMADELDRVKRVLARTQDAAAEAQPAPAPTSEPGKAGRRTASTAAVTWVALGSIGVLVGSGAHLMGAPPALVAAPVALALLIALVATTNLRRTHVQRARRRGAALADRPRPAPAAADPQAAVRAAQAVATAQELRWQETWASIGRPAPAPADLDDALAHLTMASILARRPATVIDLRDRPTPVVAVEPFGGLGPHREATLRQMISELEPGILVAIVVGDARP